MFHGEQEQHASMDTLEAILQTSKELDYKLVSLDECLGDAVRFIVERVYFALLMW